VPGDPALGSEARLSASRLPQPRETPPHEFGGSHNKSMSGVKHFTPREASKIMFQERQKRERSARRPKPIPKLLTGLSPQRWFWNHARYRAAQMLAQASNEKQIIVELTADAARRKESPPTQWQLRVWKRKPEFQGEIERQRAIWRAEVTASGIADQTYRVKTYNDDWGVTEEVPATTEDGRLDKDRMAARLKIREQVAKELGQWDEKSSAVTAPTSIQIVYVDKSNPAIEESAIDVTPERKRIVPQPGSN